jgi:Domain of unknown function (DUF4920)
VFKNRKGMQMYRSVIAADLMENADSGYKTYFCPCILYQTTMKKIPFITLLLIGATVWFSCKQAPTTTDAPATEENSFGAGVSKPEAAVSFADVNAQLDAADSVNVIMKAKVSEVCQAKGCWMNIVDGAGASEGEIFVQFQDYGFFMPKDLAGKEVIIEGKAYKQETTVEELKHYAEDAGKSAEEIAAITEPVMEKKFMATGVVVVK